MSALFSPTAKAMGYIAQRPLNRPDMRSISPLQGAFNIVARSFKAGRKAFGISDFFHLCDLRRIFRLIFYLSSDV